jgi:NAD(P)-dependent dehydrogenase (short-subunit alcohol dehydrogenase family)
MFLCCKHVIPAMLKQSSKSIVNLTSISTFIGQEAEEGGPSFFAYSVTKAGARQLATNLATRYAKEGIRVNAVAPGATRTRQVRHFLPDLAGGRRDLGERGRAGDSMSRVGRRRISRRRSSFFPRTSVVRHRNHASGRRAAR